MVRAISAATSWRRRVHSSVGAFRAASDATVVPHDPPPITETHVYSLTFLLGRGLTAGAQLPPRSYRQARRRILGHGGCRTVGDVRLAAQSTWRDVLGHEVAELLESLRIPPGSSTRGRTLGH